MSEVREQEFAHTPVMPGEALHLLAPRPGDTVVDGTLGLGGHAQLLRAALADSGLLIGIDRDPSMIEAAGESLRRSAGAPFRLFCANYSRMDDVLRQAEQPGADAILLDLGVSSPQLNVAARGFSYRTEGPLDMRMSPDDEMGAEEWIHSVPEQDLADVLYQYGQERFSRRIARAIVRARGNRRIRTTSELAEIIRRATPPGPRRLHPARRSFQAIRIFLNREMEHLDRFLEILPVVLKPGGRCVVISYHSLEDGRVKNAFREGARQDRYELLTRKPLRPSFEEIASNPRSRSARLRAVLRLPTEVRL